MKLDVAIAIDAGVVVGKSRQEMVMNGWRNR